MNEIVKNCLEVEDMRFMDLKCKKHELKCCQVLSKTAGLFRSKQKSWEWRNEVEPGRRGM